jgi:hypothetical protein
MKCRSLLLFVLHLVGVLCQKHDAVDEDSMTRLQQGKILNRLRHLGTGQKVPGNSSNIDKKHRTNSKKDKMLKMHNKNMSMIMMNPGKGKANMAMAKGKQSNKKGMKNKSSLSPATAETDLPSTPVPSIDTEIPTLPMPSGQPISSNTPTVPVLPETQAPTEQPIASPNSIVFVDSGNIIVTYETNSSNSSSGLDEPLVVDMRQTLAAINVTCEYIRTEAIIPLGAIEFACLWFFPPELNNNMTVQFPIEITYSGTAAFVFNETITTEELDASILNAFSTATVDTLEFLLQTELPTENPFSLTSTIYAEKLDSGNFTVVESGG